MTKTTEAQQPLDLPKLIGMLLPLFPGLMIRFAGVFFRFKRDAKKGGSIFHRELIRQGIDETTATKLTALYLEGSNLTDLLHYLR